MVETASQTRRKEGTVGFASLGDKMASGNVSSSASESAAPGKMSRTQILPASKADVASPLPPDVVEFLMDESLDQYEVAARLEKYKKEKRSTGKDLVAAFNFLRDHRGKPFVETVSEIMYPRGNKEDRDWFGFQDLLDKEINDDAQKKRNAKLNEEACQDTPPDVDEQRAFSGIQLFIKVKDRDLAEMDRMPSPDQFGPQAAGPYKIIPCTLRGRLVGYIAHHKDRQQNEWFIGPDSIDAFTGAVDVYVGAAQTLLPGSPHVPDSVKGGTDVPNTPPSVLQEEAFGNAPWQTAKDVGEAMFGETHGGPAAVGALNGAMRIGNYVKPARDLAQRILQDVDAGKIHHLDGRQQAVDGRNAILEDTRGKMSPGARASSVAMKEHAVTASEMELRKTTELLDAYRGKMKGGKAPKNAGEIAKLDATRARLDAESPLWGQYAAAMEKDPQIFGRAMQSLGKSREVSRAIISSAGRPNAKITGFAKFNMIAGGALAAYSIADMAYEIAEADESDRLHVAAHDLAGFAGGVIGAEGTIWMASLILASAGGPVGAPVMIVVSLLAGMAGGMIGSNAGAGLADMAMNAGSALPSLVPGTSMSAAGGFAGLNQRGNPQGKNLAQRVSDRIFELDEKINRYDRSMHTAKTEEALVDFQRDRVDLLTERSDLEDLLTAIKLGYLEGEEANSSPIEIEDAPAPPALPAMPKVDDDCAIDNDCDTRID
jgi:hypothetical protein